MLCYTTLCDALLGFLLLEEWDLMAQVISGMAVCFLLFSLLSLWFLWGGDRGIRCTDICRSLIRVCLGLT